MRLFRSQPRIALAGVDEAAAIAGLYSRAWEGLRGKLDERLIADQTPGGRRSAPGSKAASRSSRQPSTAASSGWSAAASTGTCLVDRMAVDPERNSNGIGRALAEHAIARARRAGVTKVWVQATPKLEEVVNLYRSLGFRESAHLRAHYWGEDVTLMELPL